MRVFILTRKRLAVLGAALAVVLCLGVFRFADNGTAVAANASQRSIPIYCVDTDEKKVSISFDAAWGNEQTQTLLDTLEEYKVKSTFFLVGDWVRKYPEDVKNIAKAGHDVGNHSNTHPYMTKLDESGIKSEIETCNSEVEKLTGKKPTLFRPPYGDYDNKVVDTVRGMGMYCVQWDVDTLDWKNISGQEMCDRIKKNIKNGSIILMHNGAENTPAALPMIIQTIRDLGYEIVPISELLPKGDYTTDHTGMMIPKNTSKSSAASSTAASQTTASENEQTRQTAAQVNSATDYNT
ncbi:MAG: polysaccharide deacetylase family protein, partial [Clostridia bacterium]|nr:polysaccharide deacetylase family protein [Clostridia bacterium]